MYGSIRSRLVDTISEIREAGLYKEERILGGPQGPEIVLEDGRRILNLCANNYLGLANSRAIQRAARTTIRRWGYGLSSVRFICGTLSVHKELERRLAGFLGFDDAILYSSAFDANGGLFETLLGPEDVVISDALNHASIIDGVRLCKAQRKVFATNDMAELQAALQESSAARTRLIATDGVFSMTGTIANLGRICDLAEEYDALVMVDDCHGTGVVGKSGRGSHEHCGVEGRVDIMTGTLGKALGGASGGYTVSRREIIELLRQRSRPYLFSNSLAPPIVGASLAALDLLERDTTLVEKLGENTRFFREELRSRGFDVPDGAHPIIPIMIGDAAKAHALADRLLERGVYVIGFSYPVVPEGTARIRTQVSAVHTREQLQFAAEQFAQAMREG
jgi:glycine C-acetyltransferase